MPGPREMEERAGRGRASSAAGGPDIPAERQRSGLSIDTTDGRTYIVTERLRMRRQANATGQHVGPQWVGDENLSRGGCGRL